MIRFIRVPACVRKYEEVNSRYWVVKDGKLRGVIHEGQAPYTRNHEPYTLLIFRGKFIEREANSIRELKRIARKLDF